jgi:hypothetical protein
MLGFMPRPLLINWKDALAYYEATGSLKKVAEKFGVKPEAVRQYSRRHGWPTFGGVKTHEKRAEKAREVGAAIQGGAQLVNTSAGELVGEAMKEAGGRFRVSMARSLEKAAQEIEEAPLALEHSRRMVDLVTAGKAVFGFDQSAPVIEVRALSLGLDAFTPVAAPA